MSTSSIGRNCPNHGAAPIVCQPLNQDDPHPVFNAALKKLTAPITKEQLLEAFETVMPVNDHSYMPVQNSLFDFSDRQGELEPGAHDVLVAMLTSASAKLLKATFRHESLESSAETGQGITKKELVGFLRHAYTGEEKMSFMDSLHLRDAVRSKQFARNKTAKLAKAIWFKEMTAAQAGALMGHRF